MARKTKTHAAICEKIANHILSDLCWTTYQNNLIEAGLTIGQASRAVDALSTVQALLRVAEGNKHYTAEYKAVVLEKLITL